MNLTTIIVLSIGTALMALPMLLMAWKYRISLWKIPIVAVVLTVTGTIGTYIWFWIENGWFGGRSFFGAVFFVPIAFVLFAKVMKISYRELTDLCAPAECLMLAIMKVQCLRDGCCAGRLLYVNENGVEVLFPSQQVELINAFMVFAVLLGLFLFFRKRYQGMLYPCYLILYGVSRFILNIFRAEWVTHQGLLPYGNIWSLVGIAVAVVWIFWQKKLDMQKKSA